MLYSICFRRLLLVLAFLAASTGGLAQTDDQAGNSDDFDDFETFESFDDAPLEEPVSYPPWFKLSFLDLSEDIDEAIGSGKRGLVVYFGQKYCPYCKKLLEGNFRELDILSYTQQHFDVIGIDIYGQREVTDFNGSLWTERSYAARNDVNFTPTMIFHDTTRGEALRLSGYYPPYKFRAALEFVADGHYRKEDFRTYLARADVGMVFEAGTMNQQEFFSPPPHVLDRSHLPGERPLAVFFEQGDCHACDILHTGPLRQPEIHDQFRKLDVAQLAMWQDTPVLTPQGQRTTARKWADQLGLFYSPTIIFFDERGREILRVDSVVQFYRLRSVLEYVLSGAYRHYPTFQQWRRANAS